MVKTFIRRLDGAHGRNWPGVVILNPDAPLPAATWAQEAWEAEYKLNPINLIRTRLSRSARRAMEITSHEIEVQAAHAVYGRDRAQYRLAEARAMQRGYDGLFGGMTPEDIAARMALEAPEAFEWVRDNLNRIRRYTAI